MRRRRRRSLSLRRFEIPNAEELGTSTAKRPGRETSWVRRAPLAPIGFFVTWHKMTWPGRSTCSMRGRGRRHRPRRRRGRSGRRRDRAPRSSGCRCRRTPPPCPAGRFGPVPGRRCRRSGSCRQPPSRRSARRASGPRAWRSGWRGAGRGRRPGSARRSCPCGHVRCAAARARAPGFAVGLGALGVLRMVVATSAASLAATAPPRECVAGGACGHARCLSAGATVSSHRRVPARLSRGRSMRHRRRVDPRRPVQVGCRRYAGVRPPPGAQRSPRSATACSGRVQVA